MTGSATPPGGEFAAATAVRQVEDDRYDVDLHAGFGIGGRPNGGYLLAVLARVGCDAMAAADPLAVSGHFLRAPVAGPASIRVEPVRRGRRVSTVRATLWQGDKPCIDTLQSVGELPHASPDWSDQPPPAMPPPDECFGGPPTGFTVELLDRIDLRLAPDTVPFEKPTGRPVLRGWLRWKDGSEPDVLSLLVALDAAPPTVFNLDRFGWAPTVELTALLRGRPAPGWLRLEARTHLLAGGWFDEEATLWDANDQVVAQSRQLALAGS